MDNISTTTNISSKSGWTTLILGVFLGALGAHRFYVGKIGTALLMILTLGGLGIWLFTDLIFIVSNKFEDKQGNKILLIQAPSPWIKGMIGFFAVFFSAIVCLTLLLAIAFSSTGGLVMPIKKQLSAIEHGDMQVAYSYTSTEFQKTVSFEDFKKFINHHASLKNQATLSWKKREFENDKGLVIGTLTTKDGVVIPVVYHLIKEAGQWKILSFVLNPQNTKNQVATEKEPLIHVTAEKNIDTTSSSSEAAAPIEGFKKYEDKKAKFSINYPAAWDISSKKPGQLYISGKKGSPSYYSFISIHTVPAKKIGGNFSSAKDYIESFKKEITQKYSDVNILNEGEAELPKNPKEFHGAYIMFTFTHKNMLLKRMDFIIERSDGLAFYDWSYTAPEKLFDQDLPIAKTMYESWDIK